MKWRLRAFTWNNPVDSHELRAASSKRLVFKLNAPSTLAMSIPGDHADAAALVDLVTDVVVSIDGVDTTLFRCWNSNDSLGETGYGVTFICNDYRAVLSRRKLRSTYTLIYNNVDQAIIAWEMIEAVQARVNGNYGITPGLNSTTGVLVDNVLKPGQFVGKEIDSMANRENGFDWDIDPLKQFNIYYPQRGRNIGVAIEYGKSIISLNRSKNPSKFSNENLLMGNTVTTPVNEISITSDTDPQGRWDATISFPDVKIQTTLEEKAAKSIIQTGELKGKYSVELSPGFWRGFDHIGLGDTLRTRVYRGRIADDLMLRVSEIGVIIADDSERAAGETVRLTLE